MSLKVEIIMPYGIPKLLGKMEPNTTHPYLNFNDEGEKEVIVFRCNKNGTLTDVFKAKQWQREIDPTELESGDFAYETTLKPGDDYLITAIKNEDPSKIRTVRFVQDDAIEPEDAKLEQLRQSLKLIQIKKMN